MKKTNCTMDLSELNHIQWNALHHRFVYVSPKQYQGGTHGFLVTTEYTSSTSFGVEELSKPEREKLLRMDKFNAFIQDLELHDKLASSIKSKSLSHLYFKFRW